MLSKRNQPTIPNPDCEEVQQRCEGQVPGEGLGVATRDANKAQDKDAEDNKVTCLDLGADRHREWKDHGADFCDQCDKYDNLAVDQCSISRIVAIRNCCFLLDYFKEVR
jgi:hypothetical protein